MFPNVEICFNGGAAGGASAAIAQHFRRTADRPAGGGGPSDGDPPPDRMSVWAFAALIVGGSIALVAVAMMSP